MQRVQVSGDDVQFLVEIELRFRRSGMAGCLVVAVVCGVRCALGSGHEAHAIEDQFDKSTKIQQKLCK